MCYEDDDDYDSDYDESDYDSDYDDSGYDSDYDESDYASDYDASDYDTDYDEGNEPIEENYTTDDIDESVEDIDDVTDEVEESTETVEDYETDDIDESVEDIDDVTDEVEESTETVEDYETANIDETVEDTDDTTDEVEESVDTVEDSPTDEVGEVVEGTDEAAEYVEDGAEIQSEQVQLGEGNVHDSDPLSQSRESTVDSTMNSELDTISEAISDAIEELFANESAEYIEVLEARLEQADPDVAEMVEGNLDLIEIADTFYMGTAHFNPNNGEIYLNSNLDVVNPRGAGATFYHEAAHAIDIQNNEASLNGDFESAIRSDVEEYISTYTEEHGLSREDAIDEISMTVLAGHDNHSISDIFGGVTGGECQGDYGHMPEYWDNYGMLAKETFAHFTEAAMGCPEKYEMLSKMLPTAYAEYKSIVEGLKK